MVACPVAALFCSLGKTGRATERIREVTRRTESRDSSTQHAQKKKSRGVNGGAYSACRARLAALQRWRGVQAAQVAAEQAVQGCKGACAAQAGQRGFSHCVQAAAAAARPAGGPARGAAVGHLAPFAEGLAAAPAAACHALVAKSAAGLPARFTHNNLPAGAIALWALAEPAVAVEGAARGALFLARSAAVHCAGIARQTAKARLVLPTFCTRSTAQGAQSPEGRPLRRPGSTLSPTEHLPLAIGRALWAGGASAVRARPSAAEDVVRARSVPAGGSGNAARHAGWCAQADM
jgi:hypothetical protein